MKKVNPLLKILVILTLAACVATGYYILRSMQSNLEALQGSQRLSERRAAAAEEEISSLKTGQSELGKEAGDLKTNLQNVSDDLKSKNETLAQLQKIQEENSGRIKELGGITSRIEAVMKEWQVSYVKALTGLEEKMDLADREIRNKIEAMTMSRIRTVDPVDVAPAEATPADTGVSNAP